MTGASLDTSHRDNGLEDPIVIGTGGSDVVTRRRQGALSGEFLQSGFVVLAPGAFSADGDVVDHEVENDFSSPGPAGVDEDGSEDCFEGVSEDRFLVAATRLIFATAKQHLGAYPNATSNNSKGCGIDDRGSQLGQLALGEIGVHGVDVFGDGQPENSVAKELEPFVRLGCIRLCAIAPMGQG